MNGTDLHLDSDLRYSLMAGNLVINTPVRARDSGSYQCLATNPSGTVISREALLRFGYLHEFSPDERSPLTVTEGVGFTIPCNPPQHYPGLSYRWLQKEFPEFVPAGNGRWFVSQVTGNLYVARADLPDVGNYSCFATSRIDFITKSVFSKATLLRVNSDAQPEWLQVMSDTEVEIASQLRWSCAAAGKPRPSMRWLHNGLPLSSQYLSWWNIGVPDLCPLSQAQPEWLQVMSDTEVEIASQLRWSCAAAGKPRPSMRWLHNGLPLSSQDRIEVDNGELRITGLTLEDSGMYQCVAENKHGTIYANAELRVQVQAPDFRLNPVRRLIPAARGGEVIIKCLPRAAPKPVVFWSRGTELLTNNSRVTIMEDSSLWIRNISRSDGGKYTCFAENFLGKANSTGILSVRDGTKITLAPSNADINQGENVTLQCHASHDPTMDLTFTWALDGFPLDIEQADGHYQRTTTVSHRSLLSFIGPPGPPGGVVVTNIKETEVELRWSRGYDNHSPIGKYTIESRTALSADWKKMQTDLPNIEGNAESARVLNLLPWMDYEFRVIASNILGSGEPSSPSHRVRTREAAPTIAPSGLGGGGGDRHELIISWTPMARQYQNGEAFGYILAFRKKADPYWRLENVANVESSRFMYRNETTTAYCP
ncbi:UNVERIFIED_CONTAM: hypothetical protein FKN15_050164 [Acipenser sinensis]